MSVCGSTLHTWLESKPNLYQTSPWTGCQIYLKSKDPTNAINQMTNHIQSYPVISNHIMWGQLYQKKLLNTPDVHRCSMIFMWGNCAYGIIWCIIPQDYRIRVLLRSPSPGAPAPHSPSPFPRIHGGPLQPRGPWPRCQLCQWKPRGDLMKTWGKSIWKSIKIHWKSIEIRFSMIFIHWKIWFILIYLIWFSLPFPTCCHCALLAITVTAAPYVTCQESNLIHGQRFYNPHQSMYLKPTDPEVKNWYGNWVLTPTVWTLRHSW